VRKKDIPQITIDAHQDHWHAEFGGN